MYTSTQVLYKYTSCIQVHKLHTSTQVVYKYTSCIQVYKLYTSTQVVYKYTSCIQIAPVAGEVCPCGWGFPARVIEFSHSILCLVHSGCHQLNICTKRPTSSHWVFYAVVPAISSWEPNFFLWTKLWSLELPPSRTSSCGSWASSSVNNNNKWIILGT